MKKKVYTAFICLCCAVVSLFAQERVVELTNPNESCTSIAAGKLATTDGSVMTSQTCDGTSRTWMEVVPAQNWPDTAKLDLYWDLRHTESKNDRLGAFQRALDRRVRQHRRDGARDDLLRVRAQVIHRFRLFLHKRPSF